MKRNNGEKTMRPVELAALLERYRRGQISRRDFLRAAIGTGGFIAIQAILAACAPVTSSPSAAGPSRPGAHRNPDVYRSV